MNNLIRLISVVACAFAFSVRAQTAPDSKPVKAGSKRKPAFASLEPIEEDPDDASVGRQKAKLRRRSSSSLFHVAPVVSYLNTGWKGVSSTAGTSTSAGTGGKTTAKSGFGVGVQGLIGSGQFQGETGLMYAQRNVSYSGYLKDSNGTPIGYTGNIDQTASYLEVPLLARFSYPGPNESGFFVHGGAVVGFALSQSTTISGTTYAYQNGFFYPTFFTPANANADGTLGSLNNVDFRGLAGLGALIKLTRSLSLVIQGDYQHSLTKITNSSDSIMIEEFSASTGLGFDF